ncbi:MAG: E3 ubiquitin ligase family protein [Aminivibrio sp.]|jgi:hypothetical protein
MSMVGLGVGGLLAAGGAYLAFVQSKKKEGLARELQFMKSTSLPELHESLKALDAEGLGDSFRDMVETNGSAETDGELKTPHSETPCAYFEASVTREYEQMETYTDKDGKVRTRRNKLYENVSSDKSSSPLYIADGGVRARIDLQGANLDLKSGEDRYEPFKEDRGYSFFGVNFTVPSGTRTLGFRYKERLIPLGQPLYVVGEIRKSGGELRIGKPSEKDKPFIVSVKSEEEVLDSMKGSAKTTQYFGYALIVIGAAVAVFLN